ncbi:MAG: Late embryogenesis abundant protein [Methanoregulaceae archaeon PtaU1.Bin066]|nr:MAG: Late embryogenesis abundant protein [Methanoregulaceae archaeon PtaU1.Bin066]
MAGMGIPGIGIGNVSVGGVSLSEITLIVEIIVENGNPVPIPVQSIDFDILGIVGDSERTVAHGHHGSRSIPPGTSTLEIPFIIRNSEALGSIRDLVLERSIDLRVAGGARVGFGIASYTVPINEVKRIIL